MNKQDRDILREAADANPGYSALIPALARAVLELLDRSTMIGDTGPDPFGTALEPLDVRAQEPSPTLHGYSQRFGCVGSRCRIGELNRIGCGNDCELEELAARGVIAAPSDVSDLKHDLERAVERESELLNSYAGPINVGYRFRISNDRFVDKSPALVTVAKIIAGDVRFRVDSGAVYHGHHSKFFSGFEWSLREDEFRSRATPFTNEDDLAAPAWNEIAPDLLLAAQFIEENDNASLSKGTAPALAMLLRDLVRFYAPIKVNEAKETTDAPTNLDTQRARPRVRDELEKITKSVAGMFLRDVKEGRY